MATFPSYRYTTYNVTVFYLNSIKSQFLGNEQSVFTFRSIFFPAIEGMKILITTKSHLVPLLSQQKRMKWSGTDFGWWMQHSTAHTPKLKLMNHWFSQKNVYVLCIAAVQQTNGSVLFCFWCISNLTALFDEIRGNWEENRMKENSYTMQCETKSENPISITTAHAAVCICIFFIGWTIFPPPPHLLKYPLLTLVNIFQCSTFVAF